MECRMRYEYVIWPVMGKQSGSQTSSPEVTGLIPDTTGGWGGSEWPVLFLIHPHDWEHGSVASQSTVPWALSWMPPAHTCDGASMTDAPYFMCDGLKAERNFVVWTVWCATIVGLYTLTFIMTNKWDNSMHANKQLVNGNCVWIYSKVLVFIQDKRRSVWSDVQYLDSRTDTGNSVSSHG